MTVKWEKLEGSEGKLTFEVSVDRFNEALDEAFKKVVKKVQAPGFRKGKMPRKMFNKMYGEESLYNDAIDIVLPGAYSAAVDEADVDPIAAPEIDIEKLEKGEPVVFTAIVALKPEVKLGEYKGLEVTRQAVEVTDEEVDAQLEQRAEALAEMVVKEDGVVENGDTATIDFEGFADGEAFEGGQSDNYELEVGSGSFIPGFEEQVVGMKTGEEKEVEITFPEEYHAAELAGKPATFKVKVNEIKSKEVPELDDELAKEIDESVSSVEELRTKLKEEAEEVKKNDSETALRDDLVEQAASNAEMEIPQAMIDSETDRMMQDFEQRLQMQGMNLDLYFQFSGQDEQTLRDQMKDDALSRVRVSLTLEAIGAAEEVEVPEEEVNAELEKMSEQFGMDVEQIKTTLGGTSVLENDLRFNKTVQLLVDSAKIID
ncbi:MULTISPECIES: trigger factor [unclassified Sporosarcina]|uniref:trigger factor n=1 Tax=unclassified Sporosarcina TaxID=2647733 RepID=UPI000C16E92B|nr:MULTISPECIES: trigger factor [unclassified Sporosarcina]PIC87265.1 trigger factor [Sporosarcina sp. P20a]PIC98757.1 trigger factor [Sporosarcina sp. P29]PID07304.1 trigger factor [Sporosarcina sp. P30]PID10500.1 trigger factor [Sporosarcina sp. P31]PID13085.1 trigger factor [Sporosarcina sp. P32b]